MDAPGAVALPAANPATAAAAAAETTKSATTAAAAKRITAEKTFAHGCRRRGDAGNAATDATESSGVADVLRRRRRATS